jgi:glycosyltransferase involved in cell wall biosynthesis
MFEHNKILPLCSVIIAQYNNGKYFSELYQSLINQDTQNFEVIIVDDCSTDETISIVKEIIKDDNRFKLVKHQINKGVGGAFKTAMNYVSSDIVLMLGAEDALLPNALSKLVESHIANPDASLINFPFYFCDQKLNIISKSTYKHDFEGEYFFWFTLGVDTFKKSCYDKTLGFNDTMRSAIDQDICFKLEEVGKPIFIDEPLTLYRKNKKGISQGKNALSARINHLKALISTYERREISGFTNISEQKFLEIKAELDTCKNLVSNDKYLTSLQKKEELIVKWNAFTESINNGSISKSFYYASKIMFLLKLRGNNPYQITRIGVIKKLVNQLITKMTISDTKK